MTNTIHFFVRLAMFLAVLLGRNDNLHTCSARRLEYFIGIITSIRKDRVGGKTLNSPLKNSFLFQNTGANPLILLGGILGEQRFSTGC